MKPAQGALPTLRAALDPDAAGADYYGPSGLTEMNGFPKRSKVAPKQPAVAL